MSVTRSIFVTLAVCAAAVAARAADKLDKEDKQWLDDVKVIILAEEEQTFKKITKAERAEFIKIFWARRNPLGPEADTNANREKFERLKAEVDLKVKSGGKPTSQTDCGRLYILFGPPDEMGTHEVRDQIASVEAVPGRKAQLWTYKSREGFNFLNGEIKVPFNMNCGIDDKAFRENVVKVAERWIVTPAIRYEKGKDGLITPLSELVLRQLGPAMLLLREPRKDFVLVTQAKVSLWQNDQMYIAGLLRGDAAGLTIQEAAGQKTAALKLAVTAVDGEGQRVMASERDVVATVGADNWFLSSYAAQLKPGSYTMNVALIDPVTKKGNVSSLPVFVPTPPANELMLTDLFILSGIREEQTANPKDPLWAFFLGSATLLPRFGNVYTRQDQIQFLAIGYNAPVNPATGAPATSARFVVTKDGQVKTQSPEQSYTTASIMPEAGPVPLEKFEPGFYKVMLAVTDQVTKKTYKKEATFEVKP